MLHHLSNEEKNHPVPPLFLTNLLLKAVRGGQGGNLVPSSWRKDAAMIRSKSVHK